MQARWGMMTERDDKPAPRLGQRGEAAKAERQRRQALAMRQNLKKRKVQQHAREAPPPGEPVEQD